jgi:His-Xaa-Ser system radical SAM maturase HxsB
MNCVYCQANNGITKPTDFMDQDTAQRAVDIALESPARHLSFEFQGGEPLLNFPIIQYIVEYAESKKGEKCIQYSVVSNLTLLTDEMIAFFREYDINVSTSLDGDAWLHNQNRPYRVGNNGTYQDVLSGANRLRDAGVCVGAIQTTTRASLSHAKDIINTYCENGFNSIFLRPLTPLGCASRKWEEIGYTAEEFSAFYKEALVYILEKNKQGFALQEGHAATLLSKILHGYPINHMELRSPCGAAIGQMAYYSNGDVFTCDEGRMLYEMGNDSFRLGNVNECRYAELVSSTVCRAVCLSSITESIPSCCDCVYQPYCGVCPVVNLALYRDLLPKTPKHYRCSIYSGILDTLFGLIQENDDTTMQIIESWYA